MKTKDELIDELINKATNDEIVSFLLEKKTPFKLVGGAVSDIYYGRIPKDYDFLTIIDAENVLQFEYESSFSVTYNLNDKIIQVLKKSVSSFPFKIQQITIVGNKYGEITVERMCVDSLASKKLIFNRDVNDGDFLTCFLKYIDKGFVINKIEWNDAVNRYLNKLGQKKIINS